METLPVCKVCKQPITESQRWEYTKSSYPAGTLESSKLRAHRSCVQRVLQEAIARLEKH